MVELNAAYETLVAQTEPDWRFASNVQAPSDLETSLPGAAFEDAQDSSGGSSPLRWFGIALAMAGVVMTTVVFIAAVGYDWSLSP